MTHLLKPPKIKDLIMTKYVSVSPQDSLDHVITTLLKHEIPSVPVVEKIDDKIDVLGYITEQDCVEYFANEIYYGNPDVTARTVMQRYTFCVTPETDIFTAACLFTRQTCQLLPVVHKKHDCVGLVTRRQVLGALSRFEKKINREKEELRKLKDFREIVNLRFIIK